jgi:hypothetical protein
VAIITALLIRVRIPAGIRDFLFPKMSRPVLGPTKSPTQSILCVPSWGGKKPVREINQVPPSSADITNEWSCTSTALYTFASRIDKIIPFHYYHEKGGPNNIVGLDASCIQKLVKHSYRTHRHTWQMGEYI